MHEAQDGQSLRGYRVYQELWEAAIGKKLSSL